MHAMIVAALYVIPAPPPQRFASIGQTTVISIEAIQDNPLRTADVTFMAERMPLISEPESQVDRALPTASPEPLEFDVLDRPERHDLPKRQSQQSMPELQVDTQPKLRRQRFNEQVPDIATPVEPPRSYTPRPIGDPPASSPISIEQFVGLEEKTSANLSNNRPPEYPHEAIRRKLEGTVLLRLQIAKTGKVESVELIKSSGHYILDEAAINAVAGWKGSPAKQWGRAVESVERLPIRFRL